VALQNPLIPWQIEKLEKTQLATPAVVRREGLDGWKRRLSFIERENGGAIGVGGLEGIWNGWMFGGSGDGGGCGIRGSAKDSPCNAFL